MADDDKDWEDVPAKKSGGTATATAGGDWEDVPSKEATPVAATPPPDKPSIWNAVKQAAGNAWDVTKRQMNPMMTSAAGISENLGKIGDIAQQKAEEKHTQELGSIAKGGQAPAMAAYTPSAGYDLLGRVAHMASGATNPTNLEIAGAAVAAPEIVGPALLAHGGYGVAKNAADIAEKGLNPENAEGLFTSGAEAAGGAGSIGEIPKGGGLTGPLRQTLAEKTVGGLVRKPPLATMQDIKFGRDPARAIAKEGIVAPSKEALVQKIDGRIGELSDALEQQLQNHPNAGAHIDAEPIIDKHVDRAVQDAKKVGNQGAVNRLEALRTALKSEYGPLQGNPHEMNNLKRSIGDAGSQLGAFKATDPLEASAASAMGDIYSDLKNEVNKAIPEGKAINERIADLIGAKTGVARNIALKENVSPFSVLSPSHMVAKIAEGTVGSAPVRTGLARIINAGNVEGAPKIQPFTPPVPKGLLGPGATELGMGADTSGPVPASERQEPMIWTPEMRARVARETAAPPPRVQGETTGLGTIQNPSLVGARGQGGVRTPIRGLLPEQVAPQPGPVRGPQMGLNIPTGPEEAPLFNLPNVNTPRNVPELGRIAGTQTAPPVGMAQEGGLHPIGGAGREGTLGRVGAAASKPSGVSLGPGEDLGEGLGTQHVITKDGQRIGSITVEPKDGGKTLHVHWLGGDFGPGLRPQLMDEVERLYPDAEKFTYDRRRLAKGAEAATTEQREMKIKKMTPPKT
jgi:hypothetical protein